MENEKLYEERNKILADQRVLLDLAEKEKREMTADETTNYENMDKRFTELDDEIQKIEAAEKVAKKRAEDLVDREKRMSEIKNDPIKPDPVNQEQEKRVVNPRESKEYEEAFRSFLSCDISPGEVRNLLPPELRALQQDSDIKGGYLVVPEAFQAKVIKQMKDLVFFRQHARIVSISGAQSIAFPYLKAWPGSSIIDWTGELKTGSADTSMEYQKKSMFPHPLARSIKVSNTLIRNSAINVESEVRDGLSYIFSIAEEYNFLQGDGVNKPLGVLTASDFGISTSQDVTSGGSGAIKPDDILEVVYTLKAQYRKKCRWMMGRTAIKAIRKLKDGEGRWLWQGALTAGEPSRIAGYPVEESEYFPTFGSDAYALIFGDFSHYYILEALPFQIAVLKELYAATNEIGYICRRELDGQPMLEEAFCRLKLA